MAVTNFGFDCEFPPQGPPGKDGLPGHPGQRGETVNTKNEISGKNGNSVIASAFEDFSL